MVKVCRNLAANIAESLRQLYCSSAAMFTRGLFFAKGEQNKSNIVSNLCVIVVFPGHTHLPFGV